MGYSLQMKIDKQPKRDIDVDKIYAEAKRKYDKLLKKLKDENDESTKV